MKLISYYLVLFLVITACDTKAPEPKPVDPIESKPVEPANPLPANPTPAIKGNPWDNSWKNPETVIVIDAYQQNSMDWAKIVTDKKMVAIIHRSSSGMKTDTQYLARKKIALEKGYLWGAYHLGARGNTIKQADLFLSLANDKDTLMALDLEDTSNANMMTTDEAVVFMNYVHEKTGKILVVYANDYVTKVLNSKLKNNPLFPKTKLWYARFRASVTDFPVGIWKNYFLWQFSSEINCSKTGTCLYNVPGTSFDMDINVFFGTKEQLKSQWVN